MKKIVPPGQEAILECDRFERRFSRIRVAPSRAEDAYASKAVPRETRCAL